MSAEHQPHPKNVTGPFYVVNGCCTACDVPMIEAPELFAYDDNHCFVKRQPETADEFNHAFRAVHAAELECIRYRGDDSNLLRRFAELGESHLCDVAPSADISPVFRNHVAFEGIPDQCVTLTARLLIEAFMEFLLRLDKARESLDQRFRYRFKEIQGRGQTASFGYSWFEDNFHPVEILRSTEIGWLLRHSPENEVGCRGVSIQIDDWLKQDGRFQNIRWFTESGLKSSGVGNATPF